MLNKSATITVRIEPKLKKEAEDVLDQLGISVSTMINMLYRQIARRKAIPFEAELITPDYDGDLTDKDLKK